MVIFDPTEDATGRRWERPNGSSSVLEVPFAVDEPIIELLQGRFVHV